MKTKIQHFLDRLSLMLFIGSIAVMIFAYGVAVGRFHWFPYQWLRAVENGFYQLTASKEDSGSKPHHLHTAWYDTSGARIYDAHSMAPGVTLLTGYWRSLDWKPGIRLIDSTGKVLHQWETDPAIIWPPSLYTEFYSKLWKRAANYVHGCYLYENGDIVFNIEYMGLVRMNAAGKILWTLDFNTHHSVSRDEEGNFWVCGMKPINDTAKGRKRLTLFPGLNAPLIEDFALKVSPEGKILHQISILKALYDSGYQRLVWQASFRRQGDILHLNDIEALPSAMADQYPLFDANDLAISCRFLNAIFVIDSETERIKWVSRDFMHQHDPDFIGNGIITVFDNQNDGYEDGHVLGGSCIKAIDTQSNKRVVLYPKTETEDFYTKAGGKAQRLENGNLLITEAQRGRVFEVDKSGKTVWEWIADRYNETLVPEVLEGSRYALTADQIAAWSAQ